jgi:hypothetical protein
MTFGWWCGKMVVACVNIMGMMMLNGGVDGIRLDD